MLKESLSYSIPRYSHFRVFSPHCTLHTVITHVITVLGRWSLMGILIVKLRRLCILILNQRAITVHCAIRTKLSDRIVWQPPSLFLLCLLDTTLVSNVLTGEAGCCRQVAALSSDHYGQFHCEQS